MELTSQMERPGSSPAPWRERRHGVAGASSPPVSALGFPQKKIAVGPIQSASPNKSLVRMFGALGLQGTVLHRPTGHIIMSWR